MKLNFGKCASALAGALLSSVAMAQLDQAIDTGIRTTQAGQKAQDKIDNIDQKTSELLAEYTRVNKEIEGLEVYIRQLGRQLNSQQQEIDSLNASMQKVTLIERQITPLMLKMIDALEQFVALDVPFLLDERKANVERLKETIDRSDVTVAEKFRTVHTAYQDELAFGRTIESYRGTIDTNGTPREVEFLRIGRIALYYTTLDGAESGAWDTRQSQWIPLSNSYHAQLDRAAKIAKEQAAPDLIRLPITTAERVQ